jgi:hypothetical protein
MMHGGMMFSPWGTPFGGFWLLLVPVTVLIATGIIRLFVSTGRRREQRSRKLRKMPIQDQIIKLAYRKGGLLTVTDVVAETGLSFKKAEKALNEMVDFSRVNMRVSDSGIIVYEFVEIFHKDLDNAKSLQEMGV